jgi:hypothetical protein
MFEQLAEWYLKRRGRIVLSRFFTGMVVGDAIVFERGSGDWEVHLRSGGPLIVLNNSIVTHA